MQFLGSSPITSILGYVIAVAGVTQEVIVEGGLPDDPAGWIQMVLSIVTGLALRFAKDSNVSNSSPGNEPFRTGTF